MVTKKFMKLIEVSSANSKQKITSSIDFIKDLLSHPPDKYPDYWLKAGILEISSPSKKEIAIVNRMLNDLLKNLKSRLDEIEKMEKMRQPPAF
jgi:hypothetical protein